MKILIVEKYDRPETGLRLGADSAWRPDRRPFFVPEGLGCAELELRGAVRISRLGKNISARFARRYYDSVALAAVTDTDGPIVLADDSIVLGPWQTPELLQTVAPQATAEAVDEIVARVSRGVTIKTGDVIILPSDTRHVSAAAPATLRVSHGDTDLINFNIR